MRRAPALSLTLRPARLRSRVVRVLGGIAALSALGWLGWHTAEASPPTRWMLVLAAMFCLPSWWLMRSTAAESHHLGWHPAEGHWVLQGLPGRIDCVADGGGWLVLRHVAMGARPVWLMVWRRDHAEHWHALRCAVFSPGLTERAPRPSHVSRSADE